MGAYWDKIVEPRLLQQYRDDPMFCNFLKAFCDELDELEAVSGQIVAMLDPDTAEGEALDFMGARIGITRGDLEVDADLRVRIKNAVKYRSSGTGEQVIKILKEKFAATSVELKPEYPAGFVIFQDGNITQAELNNIIGAGVRSATGYSLIDGELNNIIDGNGNYIYGL